MLRRLLLSVVNWQGIKDTLNPVANMHEVMNVFATIEQLENGNQMIRMRIRFLQSLILILSGILTVIGIVDIDRDTKIMIFNYFGKCKYQRARS